MTQAEEHTGLRPASEEGLLTLTDVIRFGRRQILLFLLVPIFAVVVSLLAMWLLVPPKYEASATLVVTERKFASELKPPELPVQGYVTLLESTAVIAQTVERLRQTKIIRDNDSLALDDELESRTFISQRGPETPLAPTIEVVAYGKTAKQAAAIANTWADVFLNRAQLLQHNTISPTIDVIEQEYSKEKEYLEELEQAWLHTAKEYQERIDKTKTSWDRKQAEYENETESLTAGYHTDTRQTMEALAAKVTGDGIQGELRERLLRILTLRTQLAQTPRFRTLEKSLSEDALWQTLISSQADGFDPEPLIGSSLVTKQANPVYDDLILSLSRVQIDLEGLSGEQLKQMQTLTMQAEQLQVERSGGLTRLHSERAVDLEDLKLKRARMLAELERERDMRLRQLEMDIGIQQDRYSILAKNNDEASLARAEENILDVRLGAPAVEPARPEQRSTIIVAAIAAVAGLIVGLLVALVREADPA